MYIHIILILMKLPLTIVKITKKFMKNESTNQTQTDTPLCIYICILYM